MYCKDWLFFDTDSITNFFALILLIDELCAVYVRTVFSSPEANQGADI